MLVGGTRPTTLLLMEGGALDWIKDYGNGTLLIICVSTREQQRTAMTETLDLAVHVFFC